MRSVRQLPNLGVQLDATPPTVAVNAPSAALPRFSVSWSGQDASRGLRDYDVAYRVDSEDWTAFLPAIVKKE